MMEVGNLKGMGGPNNNISLGKETRPFAPFIFKMIILPRQARDKRRERALKKETGVSAGLNESRSHFGATALIHT
jgi:hypothetical protein